MTPAFVDLRPDTDQVEDQGRVGNCVAMAAHKAIEVCYERVGGRLNLSPAYLYYYAREKENLLGHREDGIRFLSTAADILINKGCALESSWPTTQYNKEDQPPKALDEEAAQYRAVSQKYIERSNEWKTYLAKGIPIIINMIVTEDLVLQGSVLRDWRTFGWDTNVDPVKNPMLGLHGVLVIGYNEVAGQTTYLIQNSWNQTWGDGGFFGMPEAHVLKCVLGSVVLDKLHIPFVNAGWTPEPKERFDRLMDWAEAKFSLGKEVTQEFGPYLYRKYGETYLGLDLPRNMIVRYVTAFEDLGTEDYWTRQMEAENA